MSTKLEKIIGLLGGSIISGLAIWGASICYMCSRGESYEELRRRVFFEIADTNHDGIISQAEMIRYTQLLQECNAE